MNYQLGIVRNPSRFTTRGRILYLDWRKCTAANLGWFQGCTPDAR